MFKKIIIASICCCTTIIACQKETDNNAPVISLLLPTEGQEINATTDSVIIQATMDDADMHNFRYTVTNKADGDTLIHINPRHDHVEHIDFYKGYKLVIDADIDALLVFTAEDHSGNVSTKSVNFKLIK